MRNLLVCLAVVLVVSAELTFASPRGGGRRAGSPTGGLRGGPRGGQRGRPGRGHGQRDRLLCRIESDEADVPEGRLSSGQCPGESTCSIGPIEVQHFSKQASLTFCDAVDENGNLLIFRRACRIELEDGSVIERERPHRRRCHHDADDEELDDEELVEGDEEEEEEEEGMCTKGPLTGFDYNGQPAEAYFPQRPSPRRHRPHPHRRRGGRGRFGSGKEQLREVINEIDPQVEAE